VVYMNLSTCPGISYHGTLGRWRFEKVPTGYKETVSETTHTYASLLLSEAGPISVHSILTKYTSKITAIIHQH
jgi:hypothetical protein